MITKTDREKSLEAHEYLWDTSVDTEVHAFVGPVLEEWLSSLRGGRLLDLGCGNGVLTNKLCSLGLKCTGTDFSESGIAIARSCYPKVNFFQSSIENSLPHEHRNAFDVVIAVEVIEHLLLPRQLFARAKEALKPGGTLIVTTPYHGYFKNIALALLGKYDSHWHPLRDYGHVKFFSVSTLSQIYKEQGFVIEQIRRVGRVPCFARSMMMKAVYVK
jgi:2-polyprenyl-3-methyl-5-hydroxy-6-metoxy-1,4-benzoquinol methylase